MISVDLFHPKITDGLLAVLDHLTRTSPDPNTYENTSIYRDFIYQNISYKITLYIVQKQKNLEGAVSNQDTIKFWHYNPYDIEATGIYDERHDANGIQISGLSSE